MVSCFAHRQMITRLSLLGHGGGLRYTYGLKGGGTSRNRHTFATNFNKIINPTNDIITIETGHPTEVTKNRSYYLFDAYHGAYLIHDEKSVTSMADGSVQVYDESQLDETEYWGQMVKPKYYYRIK